MTEKHLLAAATPRVINLITSLMPTLEGMLLMTVLDGKKGHILIRFHHCNQDEVQRLTTYLSNNFPGEFDQIAGPSQGDHG